MATSLKERLKNFLEQYEMREKHFLSIVKSKDLEYHIVQAQCEQHRQKAEEESGKVSSLKAQISFYIENENELRKQLNTYIEKFKRVEETLFQSNELFHTFREEIEQMSKKTQKLEKENTENQAKYEAMNKAIQDLISE
eukprot:jgi/Hompol1/2751/HPOL_000640-RA